jgi:hypothetical protein
MSEIYTSAIKRLSGLPDVFCGSDLTIKFQWTSAIASSYIAQWKKAGLVQALGGRSDVFMNLVTNKEPNTDLALRNCYPKALKIGIDILRQAGWMTQIPARVDVAIPKACNVYDIDGYNLSPRTEKWFNLMAPGIEKVDIGINQLRPAWAFADLIARSMDKRVHDAWLPDPEDIDELAVSEDPEMSVALKAFGLSKLGTYEDIYQNWSGPKFRPSSQRQR